MARRLLSIYLIAILSAVMVAGAGAVALGYIGQTNVKVILSGPGGAVKCNRSATISAKVVSAKNRKPIANQVVNWSLSVTQSRGDGLSASKHPDRQARTHFGAPVLWAGRWCQDGHGQGQQHLTHDHRSLRWRTAQDFGAPA